MGQNVQQDVYKRQVIYARYSSNKQSEQSIEGQLRDCYAYAEKHDITIVGEYIDRALSCLLYTSVTFFCIIF